MNGVNRFCGSKSPGGRWASWHYCFSYFQEVRSPISLALVTAPSQFGTSPRSMRHTGRLHLSNRASGVLDRTDSEVRSDPVEQSGRELDE